MTNRMCPAISHDKNARRNLVRRETLYLEVVLAGEFYLSCLE